MTFVIYNWSLTMKPYIPVSRSRGWWVKKKKYIMAGSNLCSGTKYSSTEPLHYLAMFGHPSGLTIWAGFCSDNPSGMLWIFDQKCSDYIRQKAKNFSKSVRTIIWVRHLYSGVLAQMNCTYNIQHFRHQIGQKPGKMDSFVSHAQIWDGPRKKLPQFWV